jgi:hypothetical protein
MNPGRVANGFALFLVAGSGSVGSQNSKALEAVEPWSAVDVHSEGLFLDHWSQIPITSNRSWIRILRHF